MCSVGMLRRCYHPGGLGNVHVVMVDIVLLLYEHCSMMRGGDLKAVLAEVGLTQADFARLIEVTPRAIALWMADERQIPGPAEGYLRLFRLLPSNLRQIELNRLKAKGTSMRDGMFRIIFQGQTGSQKVVGMGVLIFENGRVYGSDTEAVRYDGTYVYNERSGLADVQIKVTFPPNVEAVFGISNPYEWAFDVTTSIDPKKDVGVAQVKTSLGKPITAQFAFLRSLPDAT
jgi:DNA-binding transcriptional regulator YiaG